MFSRLLGFQSTLRLQSQYISMRSVQELKSGLGGLLQPSYMGNFEMGKILLLVF